MKTAVIIARFQSPYLHEGHLHLIREVQTNHPKVVIVLGTAPLSGSPRNPFDYHTREKMIKSSFPEVIVLPLHDEPSDETWSENLDRLLGSTFSGEQFLLYGSRDSFIQYYSGKYETTELPAHGDYNATEIRAQYANKVLDSADFRAGILYAYNVMYKKVYPTVDVAVFRHDRTELLLGRKRNSTLLRFPGGFVDPEDDSYEAAAKRELMEETGKLNVSKMTYEMSSRIDDWRYRNETDKIITHLYSCDLIEGTAAANDDIVSVEWVKIDQLSALKKTKKLNNEHTPLFDFIIAKYVKNQLKSN
ncbi:MAG: NUDIX domain-containing protein [Bacteroidota bacterium]